MPEAPELQVVSEFLNVNLPSRTVVEARTLKPSVVRSLCGDMEGDIEGRTFESARRRGKFLIIGLSGERNIVINPKLTGGLQHCSSGTRVQKRVCVRLRLDDGFDLRYADDRQMGQFYYVGGDQVEQTPGLSEQGPDALDEFSFDEFRERLKGFHGEIKGILTRGRVISGIGNAYADEILFDAMVYPFKRRKALSEDELRRIYVSSSRVIAESVKLLRNRMGDRIDHKAHDKGGEPCPRCGNKITQLRANQRITSYCRRCQPGMLLKN